MPSGKNVWSLFFLTFDLLVKIVILPALLAVSMPNIFLVLQVIKTLITGAINFSEGVQIFFIRAKPHSSGNILYLYPCVCACI